MLKSPDSRTGCPLAGFSPGILKNFYPNFPLVFGTEENWDAGIPGM